MRRESVLPLCQHSDLLSLNLVAQMNCPGLQEQLNCLWIKYFIFPLHITWVHREGCLLCEQACMETILRQESLTELGVAQPTIIILVESCHEESNFIILYF